MLLVSQKEVNLSKKIFPDGTIETFEYDSEGNHTQQTDRDGSLTRYIFDKKSRLIEPAREPAVQEIMPNPGHEPKGCHSAEVHQLSSDLK